jgi:hypothetical protein
MKKIILSYCHYQGWGDSMISIFDILNLTHFLKNIKINRKVCKLELVS